MAPTILAQSGVDPEKEDWEKLQTEARPGAEKRVREYLLLDAIAQKEGIAITETELEAEFKRAAAQRGVDLLIDSAKVLPSGMPVEVK